MSAIELTAEDGHVLTAHRSNPEGAPMGAVGHGFDCDLHDDHRPGAAARAWDRTVSFLQAQLQGGE